MKIRGSTIALTTALAWLAAPAAFAQPAQTDSSAHPTTAESVIVTAPRLTPEEAIRNYVQSYAVSSPAVRKIARWRDRICPVTVGLPEDKNQFVTKRVKEIAALVGAPVQTDSSCRTNIDIVFTFNPQVLLDGIRTKHPTMLGYHDRSQEVALATVAHPVQAWYTTETADDSGRRTVDDKQSHGGVEMTFTPPGAGGAPIPVFLSEARDTQVTGFHTGNGLRSELYHVIIVADLESVGGSDIGAVADYIAMIALSQIPSYDACQQVPSIVNLMTKDCDASRKPNAVTDIDLAYMRGLYKMTSRGGLAQQRDDIADQMNKGLAVSERHSK